LPGGVPSVLMSTSSPRLRCVRDREWARLPLWSFRLFQWRNRPAPFHFNMVLAPAGVKEKARARTG